MSSRKPVYLKGRDLEIVYQHYCGVQHKFIAQDLGISEETVSNTVCSDWAKNEIALLHARTLDAIASGEYSPLVMARAIASEAMATQIALMRSPAVKAEVRARIADSLLDRAGYRPAQRVETVDVDAVFDQMTMEETEAYATHGTLPERFSGTNVAQYLGGTNRQLIDITPATVQPQSQPSRAKPATEVELE